MTFKMILFAGLCLTTSAMIAQYFAMSASQVFNISK